MAHWKLCRLNYGTEKFDMFEGEDVTVGRGVHNTIVLSSIVISRNHCVINVQRNQLIITDLQSSNGIYVGPNKIPPNRPYTITETDIIGIGWTLGVVLTGTNIQDHEKFVFKLVREAPSPPVIDRIQFQSDNENTNLQSPIRQTKHPPKRKVEEAVSDTAPNEVIKTEKPEVKNGIIVIDNVINILSDSDNDNQLYLENVAKKTKLDLYCEELPKTKEAIIKVERDDLEYDAFQVKQEHQVYADDPIYIDSDDSQDEESVQWLMRLSQSSPGKPFIKIKETKAEIHNEESSYSQIEDEDIFHHDLISIPSQPQEHSDSKVDSSIKATAASRLLKFDDDDDDDDDDGLLNDLISLDHTANNVPTVSPNTVQTEQDEIDGMSSNYLITDAVSTSVGYQQDKGKRAQMIDPLICIPRKKTVPPAIVSESKSKKTSSKHYKEGSKHSKERRHSSSKRHITNSQKEERKRKLKEIATKKKDHANGTDKRVNTDAKDKGVSNVKLTTINRGAFLTDAVQVVKPMKGRDSPQKLTKPKERRSSPKPIKHDKSTSKTTDSKQKSISFDSRVPLKSLKPLSESEEKPFSKVEPLPPKKSKKTVMFSTEPPKVHVFQIEEGNKMKSTQLVKASLDNIGIRAMPFFSLEKVTLMKILRWNPHWLEEQLINNDPPPILGHSNPPMTIFHSFNNHKQYIQLVGDLLLMEIWECLSQGYMRLRNQNIGIKMTIGSLPPVPTQDRAYELFNISVDLSVPQTEVRTVPRTGEILLISFGPDNANRRFFFVHNVRCLPSPKNNIHSFFSLSLHACYTDKMGKLKPGDTMVAISLAYIQKELMLFDAMEYLAGSPLSEAILRPEPRHFVKTDSKSSFNMQCQWTKVLNPSQQAAVFSSVSAALSDRPCIQMVQGPPGTGKSSVICAIVMSYFYDLKGKLQHNRGKILICATSNAAVDEIVCRLLNIRQNLPKTERFRMVRVGRAEAMHPLAYNISSQQLAQRDAVARQQAEPVHAGLTAEISHIEAKINMWRTQEQDAKDPERAAYCSGRVKELLNRLDLLRNGGGGGGPGEKLRADQLAHAERRIVDCAHIIVTTLSSAHNHKMRGLKRRIALCIVDEAGQAIEPETLIPLTLDVTHLTLIGDPQQLPGYICSQRAKKHGLNESLFSRLTSCAENWKEGSPVILLNRQYRMHPEIAEYPNRAFYGGHITTTSPPRPDIPLPPYCIISISSGDKGQGASGANEMEAWGVSRLVTALNSLLRPRGLSLAVVTPYNAHKELIKRNLKLLQDPADTCAPVEVNTVDSFQGQERDIVVVSLARSSGVGFLTDTGRMNVMLTRAKHALLVCLNPHAIIKNHQWRTLVEDAQRRKLYKIFPNKLCRAAPGPIQNDDILK
ncbi:helicase sen1 isoform X2 [Hyposmocoma kahamanoa]|nr:helicase sen1 isoform X2 [Hyposmocoma kahamanoa]